ncbi:GbsR/MarR family transcriptional regulator [Chitinophaga sp. HK235]|uniref:GbsR/MarR family transcriptional regulator n=1 Tax=Chitinophaga sp. HK235 TaxID=2952571 RepID=UPI001BAA2B56|nr:helix-turn-helix domain-containing protein [Chitinophaga sp. HK235]
MEKYRDRIEKISIAMESLGLTPVAARVYIYLLLSEEHQATFEQIVDYFKVSKSAVSNALKMLESVKMIESKTIGGQRKRYFSANLQTILREEYMTARVKVFFDIMDDIRSIREVDDAFSKELEDVSMLYKMMMVEIPILLERWRRTVALNRKDK